MRYLGAMVGLALLGLGTTAVSGQETGWQPIETAPLDRQIVLGRQDGDIFLVALGFWEVVDEPPFDGGRWSTQKWWDALPTHWLDIPPPPGASPPP